MIENALIIKIVAIAILVSIFICSVVITLTHLKPAKQPPSLNSSQLYTFGGMGEDGIFLSSGSRYDNSTGKWTSISSMPHAAVQMCGAVDGNKIYLFGGLGGDFKNNFELNSTTVYDSMKDTYTPLQPMPKRRRACGAAVLNGYVYVVGGAEKGKIPTSSVLRYEIKTNQWSTVTSMNNERNGLQLVESGGRLYAIGGDEDTKTVEEYDPSADRWSFVKKSSYHHFNCAATVYKGEIYVIDDRAFEVYYPVTDEWKDLLKPDYYFHTLVPMNGKLWAAGGSREEGKSIKTVFTYDPPTGNWTQQQDMDVARGYHIAFAVNH